VEKIASKFVEAVEVDGTWDMVEAYLEAGENEKVVMGVGRDQALTASLMYDRQSPSHLQVLANTAIQSRYCQCKRDNVV
jgi:hypothetical protein